MTQLQWGIIGLGNIARAFANGVAGSQSGKLVAVGSRAQESADRFGEEFGVDKRYPSYEQLLADDEVQAVYIATPHPMHGEWVIKAAEAGKHILCEKPVGINHAQAMAMIEAAVRHDVFFMEAFMYRCHPQTQKLVDLAKEGAVGEVRALQGSFAFNAGFNADSRIFAQKLGGGGILDVGCYPVSMARLIAGAALGRDFADPLEVSAVGHLCETGVDGWTFATLKFEGDILAQVGTGVQLSLDNTFTVFGSEGKIVVPAPWVPARDGGRVVFSLHKGGEVEEIEIATEVPLYGIEADTVAQYIEARQATSPAMSWNDTLGNMQTLDRWRQAIGFTLDQEKAESEVPTIHRRPLARRSDHEMLYGEARGIDKPMSRVVMGCDNQSSMPHAAAMFDGFFEAGGNAFDTAYIYGGGQKEELLGQWMKDRGVRDEVVLISKGAHSPNCFPDKITSQLHESLERLQTDHADIYFMHRDNLEVPVGEFVDVLNEHKDSGRITAFGGSNWSIERVVEANAYAAKNDKTGFSVLSNNFSLARMVEAVWDGCLAASDPDYRHFLEEEQLALMPWSSQARGFFLVGRAHPDKRDDEELVRCWYCDDNFQRLERVNEMAQQRGVLPINIALAYVLCQPFPTFPLIGPRTLEELRTSLPALGVGLTEEERRWLNLED